MQDKPNNGFNLKLFLISGLLLVLPTWYVFYHMTWTNLPVDVSTHGYGVDNLLIYVHILMGVLFVGWVGYFIYVLLRFSKKRNPQADYIGVRSHASSYLEGIVALVEGVLLV